MNKDDAMTQRGEDYKRLEARFLRMFGCDSVRIEKPVDTLFLLIGHKRRSEGEWLKSSESPFGPFEPATFDYTEEHIIASGKTVRELIASAKEYKRLSAVTMQEYLRELGVSV